jgi:hypothetical protein
MVSYSFLAEISLGPTTVLSQVHPTCSLFLSGSSSEVETTEACRVHLVSHFQEYFLFEQLLVWKERHTKSGLE